MQATTKISSSFTDPLYTIGDRVKQGRIIGINHVMRGWQYTVLNEESKRTVKLAESEIKLLSQQEREARILAEIDSHMTQLVLLQKELNTDLEIRTPFGEIQPPRKASNSINGTSRLSKPRKKKVSA
ncbi:hypothetical protein NOS3756_55940 (plasmid) [Nostoc sp. NIES-3756]|uniref:hypothetical protein n=1 Tax=Nostoc sp. NIES-3756 TaxID=1751286 RepID=UPI00071FE18C|nr:hypothetical protein [Nostoc sp. NIES-3756]BAT56582.1 hypothetical protein NOS3756_55940 [Nostoc sp. NIES-3756]